MDLQDEQDKRKHLPQGDTRPAVQKDPDEGIGHRCHRFHRYRHAAELDEHRLLASRYAAGSGFFFHAHLSYPWQMSSSGLFSAFGGHA